MSMGETGSLRVDRYTPCACFIMHVEGEHGRDAQFGHQGGQGQYAGRVDEVDFCASKRAVARATSTVVPG